MEIQGEGSIKKIGGEMSKFSITTEETNEISQRWKEEFCECGFLADGVTWDAEHPFFDCECDHNGVSIRDKKNDLLRRFGKIPPQVG